MSNSSQTQPIKRMAFYINGYDSLSVLDLNERFIVIMSYDIKRQSYKNSKCTEEKSRLITAYEGGKFNDS